MNLPFQKVPRYVLPKKEASEVVGLPESEIWLVLVGDEAHDPVLMELLQKILIAIDIDFPKEVYRIIIRSGDSFYLSNMLPESSSGTKLVFSFGVSPHTLGLELKHIVNETFQLMGHRFLFTDSLHDINTKSEKKRALWKALQPLKVNS